MCNTFILKEGKILYPKPVQRYPANNESIDKSNILYLQRGIKIGTCGYTSVTIKTIRIESTDDSSHPFVHVK